MVPEGRKLFSNMTVLENLNLGAYPLHRKGRKQEVKENLDLVYTLFPRLFKRAGQLGGHDVGR